MNFGIPIPSERVTVWEEMSRLGSLTPKLKVVPSWSLLSYLRWEELLTLLPLGFGNRAHVGNRGVRV